MYVDYKVKYIFEQCSSGNIVDIDGGRCVLIILSKTIFPIAMTDNFFITLIVASFQVNIGLRFALRADKQFLA